jgi:hypothetical protein
MTRTYDLVMTHKLDADDYFIHCVQRHCAESRLNFFLVEPLWVEAFFEHFKNGKIWPRALLNMHSEHHRPDEIYHRLVNLAAERGSFVIDPPDRAQAAFDKARVHPRLVEAGIPVPLTVIAPSPGNGEWQLTDADRAALGTTFIIKPAMGYGRKGLVLDAASGEDLARSAAAWPDTQYLLQRRVVPRQLNGEPIYFRAFFVFGAVWLSWWNCFTDRYHLVTPQERETLGLAPLEDIVRRIAALTRMNFFSSEIAQAESGEFIVIDYVNDQCHMLSQSTAPQNGVPDGLVAAIARSLVDAVSNALRTPQTPLQ